MKARGKRSTLYVRSEFRFERDLWTGVTDWQWRYFEVSTDKNKRGSILVCKEAAEVFFGKKFVRESSRAKYIRKDPCFKAIGYNRWREVECIVRCPVEATGGKK